MSLKSKLENANKINILRKEYEVNQLSTTEIAKNSENLFGFKVSASTIYKELVKHSIPLRSKSKSVSMAKSTLPINETYMDEDTVEWVDGFLLGDGGINFRKDGYYGGSRFAIGSSQKEWINYGMEGFSKYKPSKLYYGKIDEKHPNPTISSRTLTHPDIVVQAKRWYCGYDYKKKIPLDVRITPVSLLLWYLGDGSIEATESRGQLRLATCSFATEDIENILLPKMADIGIRCTIYHSKNDVHVCADSIGRFFNIIGHVSPIRCYQYKFDIPEWLNLKRLSNIVKNDREKWRAQSYYKNGSLECSKSPGGKMLLFTEEQADKLRERLKG